MANNEKIEALNRLKVVLVEKGKTSRWPEEQAAPFLPDSKNYDHVNRALGKYTKEYVEAADDASINRTDLDNISKTARNARKGGAKNQRSTNHYLRNIYLRFYRYEANNHIIRIYTCSQSDKTSHS